MTPEQLKKALPFCRDYRAWARELAVLKDFGIDTPGREAAFVAQVGHESAHFTRLVEGLSYSVRALMQTWPTRFPNEEVAKPFARNPERLGNFVYASRMGNGPFESGDGFRYRGRGLIQITGRDNYRRVSEALGIDYVQHPQMLERPTDAAKSAGWYWQSYGLNDLADAGDFETITRRINGGLNGLEDRKALWALAKKALAA